MPASPPERFPGSGSRACRPWTKPPPRAVHWRRQPLVSRTAATSAPRTSIRTSSTSPKSKTPAGQDDYLQPARLQRQVLLFRQAAHPEADQDHQRPALQEHRQRHLHGHQEPRLRRNLQHGPSAQAAVLRRLHRGAGRPGRSATSWSSTSPTGCAASTTAARDRWPGHLAPNSLYFATDPFALDMTCHNLLLQKRKEMKVQVMSIPSIPSTCATPSA